LSLHASIESVYDFEPPQLLVLTFFDADPDLDPAFDFDPDLDPASENEADTNTDLQHWFLPLGPPSRERQRKGSGVTGFVTKYLYITSTGTTVYVPLSGLGFPHPLSP
jgi:hypothetical protein